MRVSSGTHPVSGPAVQPDVISPDHPFETVDAELPLTVDLHQKLHWDAIRAVCQEQLPTELRRDKLRFLIAGLMRGRDMALAAASAACPAG